MKVYVAVLVLFDALNTGITAAWYVLYTIQRVLVSDGILFQDVHIFDQQLGQRLSLFPGRLDGRLRSCDDRPHSMHGRAVLRLEVVCYRAAALGYDDYRHFLGP